MIKYMKIIITLLLLLVTISFTSCGDPKEKSESTEKTVATPYSSSDLLGQWVGTGDEISTLTFGKNGSYKDDAGSLYVEGTYTCNEAAGTFTVKEKDYGLTFVYSVELSGDNLTIQTSGGLPRTFTKK